MNLIQYKAIQKTCIEESIEVFKEFTDRVIYELCLDTIPDNLSVLDKMIILLNIRKYSVSSDKHYISYKDGKQIKVIVPIDTVLQKILTHLSSIETEFVIEDYPITKIFCKVCEGEEPTDFIDSFEINGEIINENIVEIFELIPTNIKIRFDEFLAENLGKCNNIELFTLHSKEGEEIRIEFNMNQNYIYDLIRFFWKDDLLSLYKTILDMKTYMNISFNELEYMTLSEMNLYINMYNENKENEANKSKGRNNLP